MWFLATLASKVIFDIFNQAFHHEQNEMQFVVAGSFTTL